VILLLLDDLIEEQKRLPMRNGSFDRFQRHL